LDATNVDGKQNTTLSYSNPVSEWKDLSGNSKNLTQSESQRRPHLIGNSLNKMPVVRFDGIKSSDGDYLKNNHGLQISGELSIFLVTNKSSYGGAYEKILAIRGSDGKHGHLISEGPSPNNFYVYASTPSGGYTNIIDTNSLGGALITNSSLGDGEISISISGRLIGKKSHNYPVNGNEVLTLGWAYGSEYWDGDIAEVLIFNKKLSEQKNVDINYYLSKKWGLTSTMDSDGDGKVDSEDIQPTVYDAPKKGSKTYSVSLGNTYVYNCRDLGSFTDTLPSNAVITKVSASVNVYSPHTATTYFYVANTSLQNRHTHGGTKTWDYVFNGSLPNYVKGGSNKVKACVWWNSVRWNSANITVEYEY
jgi:hypothetical protein